MEENYLTEYDGKITDLICNQSTSYKNQKFRLNRNKPCSGFVVCFDQNVKFGVMKIQVNGIDHCNPYFYNKKFSIITTYLCMGI